MANRNTSSSSSVLLVVILVLTFPIWIGICGALFGVVMGVFGALIGVMGAIFGVGVTLIALPFKILFGWGHWGWHGFPHIHSSGFVILALIIFAILIVRGRKTA